MIKEDIVDPETQIKLDEILEKTYLVIQAYREQQNKIKKAEDNIREITNEIS